MAQRQTVQMLDDVDGSPATQAIAFTLNGVSHQIDLNDDHATSLRAGFDVFIQHARTTSRRTVGHQDNYRRTTVRPDNTVIRSWAQEQGIPVSPTGRIAHDVIRRYEAAH